MQELGDRLGGATVSVYECDNKFAELFRSEILYGAFNMEGMDGSPSAVIDEELAWRMFSRVDCVGSVLKFNGLDYRIAGVYSKSQPFSLLTARERYAVYTGHSSDSPSTNSECELLIRCRTDTDAIMFSMLAPLHPRRQVNLNVMVNDAVFWCSIFFCLSIFIFLWRFARFTIQSFSALSKTRRVIHIGILAVVGGLLVWLIAGLRFSPDPRSIPPSLIDFDAFFKTLDLWFSGVNSGLFTGGMFYAEVYLLHNTAVCLAVLSTVLIGLNRRLIPGKRT